MTNSLLRRFVLWFSLLGMMVMLSACGGGAGGGQTTTPQGDKLTVNILAPSGSVDNRIPIGSQYTVEALFTDASGNPIRDAFVRLAFDGQLARAVPDSAASLTDATGRAKIGLVGVKLGVDTLRITANSSDNSRSASLNLPYEIIQGANPVPKLQLKFLDASGNAITNLQAGVGYRAVATFTDSKNQGIAGSIVSFNADNQFLTLNPANGTALTGSNGEAVLDVVASSNRGASVLTASVASSGSDALSSSLNFAVVAGPAQPQPTFSLALLDGSGTAVSFMQQGQRYQINATVLDQNGRAIPNALVQLDFDSAGLTMTPESGQMLTDSRGVASASVVPKDKLGAGGLSASTALVLAGNTLTLRDQINYEVRASTQATPSLTLDLTDSKGVALPDNALAAGGVANLVATVLDGSGKPIPGALVSFERSGLVEFNPASGTDLSDSRGRASVAVLAGSNGGAGSFSGSASVSVAGVRYALSASLAFKVGSSSASQNISLIFSDSAGNPVSSNQLTVGGSAYLTAILRDDAGQPLSNQIINFSNSSDIAALSPNSMLSNASGKATVALTGNALGAASVSAGANVLSGGVSRAVSAVLNYQVLTATPKPASTMALNVLDGQGRNASSLQAGVAYRVVATLKDGSGNNISGAIVQFAVDSNMLTMTPASGAVLTGSNGQAAVDIVPLNTRGATTLQAQAVLNRGDVRAAQNIEVVAGPTQAQPTLSTSMVDNGGVAVSFLTSGQSYRVIATVRDQFGGAIRNALVKLEYDNTAVTLNPESGQMLTDSNGVAMATLVARDKLGAGNLKLSTDLVMAGSPLTLSDNLGYEIRAASQPTPPSMQLSLTNASGAALANNTLSSGGSAVARVVVLDGKGQPLPNVLVRFANAGTLASPNPASDLTDAAGRASINLQAGNAAGADSVSASATVLLGGVSYELSRSLNYKVALGTPAATPSLVLGFGDINGNPVSGSNIARGQLGYIVATARNELGQPLAEQLITFDSSSDIGSLEPVAATALTDASGKAVIGLRGVSLGAATISASASLPNSNGQSVASSGTLNYQIINGGSAVIPPALSLSATSGGVDDSTLAPDDTLTVTATVLDNNVPVANQRVRFSLAFSGASTLATASANSVSTNASGQASIQLTGLHGGAAGDKITATASAIYKGQTLQQSQDISYFAPLPAVGSISIAYPVVGQPLSYKGSATVTVRLVDAARAGQPPFTQPINVKLSSACQAKGQASFDDDTPFADGQGIAIATYRDLGCGRDDVITAVPQVSGGISRNISVDLSPVPAPSSGTAAALQFVDATPTTLAVRGSGGGETAIVRFRVLDSSGAALANQTVNFSLQALNGIASLNTASAISDGQGLVSASVQSGNSGGPVSVTAVLASNSAIWAQSNQLLVSTRIPHQNGFSLSASTLNPEFWEADGVSTNLVIYASDRFGNPVPDNTVVSFRTEGGIGIVRDANNSSAPVGSCLIKDSSCTVTLTSSGQRGQIPGGRMTVLAYARGEDSFVDNDGNGGFSNGDTFPPPGAYGYGEPYIDANENGAFNAGEEYVDFDNNAAYSNGQESGQFTYHGLSCSHNTLCSTVANTRYVYDRVVVVWSGSTPTLSLSANGVAVGNTITLPTPVLAGSSCPATTSSLNLRITDQNGEPMPANTTVSLTPTGASIDNGSFTVANTNSVAVGAPIWSATLTSTPLTITDALGNVTGCQNTAGSLKITVSTPRGVASNYSFALQ